MLFGGGRGEMTFDEQYHCFSGAFADKPQLEEGDKILLPTSAFEQLARLQVEYPMLFELRTSKGRTHCGVLEFTAPEGTCYLPFWMQQNLMIGEGGLVSVRNVSLPKAQYVKFKPQSVDFLDISNPRAVLERQLRTFSCVTVGDQICLPYNGKRFYLEIQEVRPGQAACIIETDCNVDFDAPVGYREPTPSAAQSQQQQQQVVVPEPVSASSAAKKKREEEQPSFVSFSGSGARLDGNDLKPAQAAKLRPLPPKTRSDDNQPLPPSFATDGITASGDKKAAAPPPPTTMSKKKSTSSFAAQPTTSKWAKNAASKTFFSGSGNKLSGGK